MSGTLDNLGNHVDLVMGQAPPGKECNKEGKGTIFVKAGEFDDRFPKVREWTTKPLRMAQSGDVLVCVVGATAGKVNDAIDCAIGRSVAAVRPRLDTIDHGYLYRFLQLKCLELRAESQGLAQGVITRDMLNRLKIPLPQMEEQRRIAGILDQADALRRLRTRALDKLNTLGQAIFHDMFGAALANQFFEFGKAVEEFRYGTSNKSGEGGLPALRIPNVIGGGIDTGEIKTVEVTGAELDRLRLQEGDVLFVRTNGNPDYVGRCASFSQDAVAGYGAETDWIFASYLIRARLSDRINPVFAKTYFASQIGRKAIRERCKTSAGQFNINTEGLSSLPFPDVSREQQDRFAQTVAAIEKNSALMKASAAAMERKFSSLQYSAFRGEL